MSLYADYLKERTEDHILECEDGFATYRFLEHQGKKTVYIVELYTIPELRKTGVASKMADAIAQVAKELDCVQMIGSVVPSSKHSTASVKVLLAYGMSLDSSLNDFILFKKDI